MKKLNDVATALEIALGGGADSIPNGCRTAKQWSEIWGRSVEMAQIIIRGHLVSGKMEKQKFRVDTSTAKGRLTSHYRAVELG